MGSRRYRGAESSKKQDTETSLYFVPDTGTYSQLVKPSLNSASSPVALSNTDGWDPALTLGWANRGIGSTKIISVKDTLMSNIHLTGVKLAGGW